MLGKIAIAGVIGSSAVTGGVALTDNDVVQNMQQKMYEFRGSFTQDEREAIQQKRAQLREEYYADWSNLSTTERFEAKYEYAEAFNQYLKVDLGLETPFTHISEWFNSLSEENQTLLMGKYNELVSEYDWDNMTVEDAAQAKDTIRTELESYITELGLELPDNFYVTMDGLRHQVRDHARGLSQLSPEQIQAFNEFKTNLLQQYDWDNMTIEEKEAARDEIATQVQAYLQEQGIEITPMQRIRERARNGMRNNFRHQQSTQSQDNETNQTSGNNI